MADPLAPIDRPDHISVFPRQLTHRDLSDMAAMCHEQARAWRLAAERLEDAAVARAEDKP